MYALYQRRLSKTTIIEYCTRHGRFAYFLGFFGFCFGYRDLVEKVMIFRGRYARILWIDWLIEYVQNSCTIENIK